MRLPKTTLVAPALALLVLTVVACSGSQAGTFPSFVYASDLNLKSYRAAAATPQEVVAAMPCYCGCGDAPDPHGSLRDCFYDSDGSYSDHASGCDLCGRIMLDVQEELRGGNDLEGIWTMLDAKYSVYGRPTDNRPLLQ